VYLRGVTSS